MWHSDSKHGVVCDRFIHEALQHGRGETAPLNYDTWIVTNILLGATPANVLWSTEPNCAWIHPFWTLTGFDTWPMNLIANHQNLVPAVSMAPVFVEALKEEGYTRLFGGFPNGRSLFCYSKDRSCTHWISQSFDPEPGWDAEIRLSSGALQWNWQVVFPHH